MWGRLVARQLDRSASICGAVAGLLLSACSGNGTFRPPSVVVDTPTGAVPLYTPTPAATNGLAVPPAGLEGPLPVPEQYVDRSGSYAGTAVPLDTGGGVCLNTLQVKGFRVRGNTARFGGYRGTIDANSGLQMVFGQNWIVGQFDGTTFHGQFDLYQRYGPGCTYMLSLQRVGS